MRLILIAILICGASFRGIGQGYFWESARDEKKLKNLTIDAGLGLRMYSGDIQQRGGLFNPMKFAYGLGVRYQARPHIGLALHAAGRSYAGKAERGGFSDAIDEMSGKLWEGALILQYSVLKWEDFTRRSFTDRDPVTKGNVFIGVGGGAAMFNASYTSRYYKEEMFTDSLGRDSAAFVPVDASGSGSGIAFSVPVVFGMRYRFTPSLNLAFESHYSIYFSDNLDGLERGRNDGMALFMIKLGYTFAQDKTAAKMGKTPRQLKKGR